MLQTFITLLLIQIAIVILLDITGISDEIKRWVWNYTYPGRPYKGFSFKPWTCSLCMTHHIGLLYLIIWGKFSLLLYVLLLLLAIFTPITKNIILLVKDFIEGIIYQLSKLTERLTR